MHHYDETMTTTMCLVVILIPIKLLLSPHHHHLFPEACHPLEKNLQAIEIRFSLKLGLMVRSASVSNCYPTFELK